MNNGKVKGVNNFGEENLFMSLLLVDCLQFDAMNDSTTRQSWSDSSLFPLAQAKLLCCSVMIRRLLLTRLIQPTFPQDIMSYKAASSVAKLTLSML